jgi:choline dehydrogenase-like flavoprotein
MAMLRDMLPGLIIGLAFLPGRYSDNRARLVPGSNGLPRLEIEGGHSANFRAVLKKAIRRLRMDLLRLGGVMLPGSLQVFAPGADVHYAGSLAMGRHTDTSGQMEGAPGLHVVDGAALPTMPARNPTLTIMANAERIGAMLATSWAHRQ